ncbi:MAG TPA: ABC transporter ATP-binding protein [Gemmataceae bacterium]|nr:ABC transporter ATP-binding protein [Gemmataceae bacterium]
MPVIETNNIVKLYGPIQALRDVSVGVERGEIFGLLGQNGAGKTTLVKILLGITGATAGEARMLDQSAGSAAVRRRVGYLPEDHRFPDYHTGYSLLDFYGAMLDVPRAERRKRIPPVLELVGLKGRMDSKIRTYSKGMKQRLGIAQAIFHGPEIIFLDEPTDGVDPVGRREIRELMERLKEQGKTIFVNSHLLSEVELVCDRVAILRKGEVVQEGSVEALTARKGQFVVGLAPGQAFPADEVRGLGYAVAPSGDLWEVGLKGDQTIDPVVDLLRSRGLGLRHLVEKRQTLEELFMATVEGAEPGVDTRAPVPPGPSPTGIQRPSGLTTGR